MIDRVQLKLIVQCLITISTVDKLADDSLNVTAYQNKINQRNKILVIDRRVITICTAPSERCVCIVCCYYVDMCQYLFVMVFDRLNRALRCFIINAPSE